MLRIAAVAGSVLIAFGAVSYSGFCFSEGRFLSDDEKIRAAVAYVVSRQSSFIDAQTAKGYSNYRSDLETSVGEFLRRDPKCCRIGPEGGDGFPEPTVWRRLSGRMSAIVVVEQERPGSSERRVIQVAISNCGRAW